MENSYEKYDFSLFEPRSNAAQKREISKEHKTEIIKLKTKQTKPQRKIMTKQRFLLSLFVAAGIVILSNIFVSAQVNSLSSKSNTLKKEIRDLRSISTMLSVQYEEIVGYSSLESAAKELGMNKLERNQVTYIKIEDQKEKD